MQKKSAKKCLDFAGIEVLAKPIFTLIVKDSGMRIEEEEKKEAKRTKVLQCL